MSIVTAEEDEGVKSLERRFKELDDVTAIAISPGNSDANEYMRGMANGLILAQAIIKDQEPAYIGPNEPIVPTFRDAAKLAGTVSDEFTKDENGCGRN